MRLYQLTHSTAILTGGNTARENWTKMKLAILDGDEIAAAYSVPRLIALEYQLSRICKNYENLDEILQQIKNHLKKQSEVITEVSCPFSLAFISRDGFRKV